MAKARAAAYRMTPKRKAALKKAQLASAKARRRGAKKKSSSPRRRGTADSSVARRRSAVAKSKSSYAKRNARRNQMAKRMAVAAKQSKRPTSSVPKKTLTKRPGSYRPNSRAKAIGAVALGGGAAALTYRNREAWLVEPYNLLEHRYSATKAGYSKEQVNEIVRQEKINHRHRSTFRARQFNDAIKSYRGHYGMKNPNNNGVAGEWEANYEYIHGREFVDMYYLSRHARARQRLNRMKGKTKGFDYKSGKRRKVVRKGNRRQVKVRWF